MSNNVILSFDPGTTRSAYAVLDRGEMKILGFGLVENEELNFMIKQLISKYQPRHLVIEMIKSYGNAMSDHCLMTCVWIGRFWETWNRESQNAPMTLLPRKTIVTEVCMNPRANDTNVRRAMIDMFGEVGTKKNPGPLFGVANDIWSAIAVGVGWDMIQKREFVKLTNELTLSLNKD